MISSTNLHSHHFHDIVRCSDLFFRNGMDVLMKACTTLNVPIVIVSAALTDIVERSIDLLIEEIGSEGDKIDRNLVHIIANNSDFCP